MVAEFSCVVFDAAATAMAIVEAAKVKVMVMVAAVMAMAMAMVEAAMATVAVVTVVTVVAVDMAAAMVVTAVAVLAATAVVVLEVLAVVATAAVAAAERVVRAWVSSSDDGVANVAETQQTSWLEKDQAPSLGVEVTEVWDCGDGDEDGDGDCGMGVAATAPTEGMGREGGGALGSERKGLLAVDVETEVSAAMAALQTLVCCGEARARAM